jgi:uncharacterized protein YabN with tetrapyrrole methylase and pyrophosphatase domain
VKRVKKVKNKARVSIEGGLSENGPALSLACLLTKRAAKAGFDWPDLKGVVRKLDEETKEFKQALSFKNRRKIREEIGDLLFVMVNLARYLGIDPEDALRSTLKKFILRFGYVEKSLRGQGRSIYQSNLAEMDRLWKEAKAQKERPKSKTRLR